MSQKYLVFLLILYFSASEVLGDIFNIKIDDDKPVWVLGVNETTLGYPESSVVSPDSNDVVGADGITTTLSYPSDQHQYLDERQEFGQSEDLSSTYYPGYCRCISKYYCNGANFRVVRKSKAINTPPCRNRDEVMCCITNGPGCGVPANFPYFNPYPLYGEATFGDHPWTALVMDTNNQLIYGLGIVISWKLVITTARNVQNIASGRTGRLKVRLGEWDLSSNDEPFKPREYGVSEVIIHPNFNPRTYQNDIAILRLTSYVDLSSFPSIRSGCLAMPNVANKFAGANCLVAGWGFEPALKQGTMRQRPSRPVSSGGIGQQQPQQPSQRPINQQQIAPQPPASTSPLGPPGPINNNPAMPIDTQQRNILKEVDLQLVEGNLCQEALRRHVGDPQFLLDQRSFMCAGGERGKGLCKGDEGAALVCKDRASERYTVVGMASWGTTCGQPGFPVVFTNMANYYDWIKSVDPQIGQ